MLWDPFLMKKLIKSVICGSVNSAYMHCSLQKVTAKSTIAVTVHWTVTATLQMKTREKKKKKKEQNATQRELSWIQTHTKYTKILTFYEIEEKRVASAHLCHKNIEK